MAASNSYTAIYKQDGDSWIGWIEEVPGVNAQEKTKNELFASLKLILKEALKFKK
jgi:predicted RNase H-like HicB family nuclease